MSGPLNYHKEEGFTPLNDPEKKTPGWFGKTLASIMLMVVIVITFGLVALALGWLTGFTLAFFVEWFERGWDACRSLYE